MRILGIETSCDETGIAIYDDQQGLLAHELFSQVKLHADYGGVVPELASRDHVRKILPLIHACLQSIDMRGEQLDAIAYTRGPGLIGALLVGANVAKALAYAWQKPLVGVHHMEGHLLAPMLSANQPQYPYVALLVSGGHSMFVDVQGLGAYQILGESIDDAAGEAFDKTAKLLGLDYPGGPLLAKLASQGGPSELKFPRPMTDRPGMDLSFSGLKTFAANTIAKLDKCRHADIAWAFQDAVVDTLLIKAKRALLATGHQRLVMAGGVAANQHLRRRFAEALAPQTELFYPEMAYCTDNGAMIAYAGAARFLAGQTDHFDAKVKPRWPIDELAALTK